MGFERSISIELEYLADGETYNNKGVEWDKNSVNILLFTIYQTCYPKTPMERAFPSKPMQFIRLIVKTKATLFKNNPEDDVYKNKVIPFIQEVF